MSLQYVCIGVLQHKGEWLSFLTELSPWLNHNAVCKKLQMYDRKQLAAIWQDCIERAPLAQRIMTQQSNCATPHSINMDNAA